MRSKMTLTLGSTFPNFEAEALGCPKFNFYEYLGEHWGILFSHPDDYTPVCTTELAEAAKLAAKFKTKNCKLVGLSCNDLQAHSGWAKDIMELVGRGGEELPFPLVSDKKRQLAVSLGIMDPAEADKEGLPLTCRAVFFITPSKQVAASILYPATSGRSFKEILRVLDSLQLTARYPVATPVEWTAGDRCCVLPTLAEKDISNKLPKGYEKVDLPSQKGYLRFTPDPSV